MAAEQIQNRTPVLGGWLPVLTLVLSVFVFNTSEFVPIGLLSDIAADFRVTEARAGFLITGYAWVVAVMSLPLMLLVSRMECRRLMLGVVGLFVLSHIGSALSSGYWTLMLSRVGVACSHAVFWSVVSPLAVQVAPPHRGNAALGWVVAGSSVAMIVGLPLGRVLGLYLGWRTTFLAIGILSALCFVLLLTVFPTVQSRNAVSLRQLPALISRPAIWGIYAVTVIAITGHFTAYSYIEPFLTGVAGMGENAITIVLVLFGLVGIAVSFLYSHFYERHPMSFIRYAIFGIALFPPILDAVSGSHLALFGVCILWGLAIAVFNIVFQAGIIRFAPQGTAVAMSIYSGIYNVGIGSGALVGGIVCTAGELSHVGYWGGAISAVAALFCLFYYLRVFRKASEALKGNH